MILGDEELNILLHGPNPIISPYCGKPIEGACLEMRAGELAEVTGKCFLHTQERLNNSKLSTDFSGQCFRLMPMKYYLITTVETIAMPEHLLGHTVRRTTLQRSGVVLIASTISPGYKGRLTFGIINFHSQPFELEHGARIVGIEFEQILNQTTDARYKGQWNGGRVTTGGVVEVQK